MEKLDITSWTARAELERAEGWQSIARTMPSIRFPADWAVRIIPPFGGATARFVVTNTHGALVSVYADHYARLGVVPYPYWEVHCVDGRLAYDSDDPERFKLEDVDELVAAIARFGDPVANMRDAMGGAS